MNNRAGISLKQFMSGAWQAVFGLVTVFGVFVVSASIMAGFIKLAKFGWFQDFYVLMIAGPASFSDWLFYGFYTLCIFVPPILLGIFVARDAGKFKQLGVATSPVWWGIGSALPSAVVVVPIYFIKRNLIWRSKFSQDDIENAKLGKYRGLKFVLFVLMIVYVVGLAQKFFDNSRTPAAVEKIHATKLTLDDVLGKNLPPSPPPEAAAATVPGIDANKNGIRDDVELAIFDEYPNSAKTRAVLLQYALALQMEMIQTVVNEETVTAVVEDVDRATHCIWSISSRSDMKKFDQETTEHEDFVKSLQINTDQRNEYQSDFFRNLGSYTSPRGEGCDLNLSELSN